MNASRPAWATSRADEYREMAKDSIAMGEPTMALNFLRLAKQEEDNANAWVAVFGSAGCVCGNEADKPHNPQAGKEG